MDRTRSLDRPVPPLWFAIGVPALVGLVLRIAAGQGDYWLDEAWSAVFARDAGSVGRVFFAINHDNNHYLNTLWLQLVGWGSPPLLGRALSIGCGTAGIVVAGLIGARRGLRAAAITATLFALSPILVIYGSEARGYAPMLLALLVAIWIVDRQLFGTALRRGPIWLGIAALLGMLAHVSMLFGVAAITGWVAIEQARRLAPAAAALATLRLMGRAIVAVIAVLVLIAVGAAASPTGLRMGSITAFSHPAFVDALDHMLAYTVGAPFVGPWLLLLLFLPLFLRKRPAVRDRNGFYLLAIFGLPMIVSVIQPDNSAFPRYYLLSAVALLLLLADILTIRRAFSHFLIGAIAAGSLFADVQIIAAQRGDPGAAIVAMREEEPGGAAVMLEDSRDGAVLDSAAATHGYPLLTVTNCSHTRFLFMANNGTTPFLSAALRCGTAFRPIASGETRGLSGMDWQLYERVR